MAGMSEKKILKNDFHKPENPFPLTRMQNLFKNTFPLDGKIKLPVAGVSENGRKKWFLLARKSISSSRYKIIFQNLDFPVSTSRKKSLNKRILFELNRKLVSIGGNGEFV